MVIALKSDDYKRQDSKMHLSLVSLPLFGMPGVTEMLIIGGIVVLLFGTSKIAKLGKGLGEGIRNFKEGVSSDSAASKKENTDSKQIEIASDDSKEDKCEV